MKIVLLPGLDGTGKLFKPFLEQAPDNLDIQCINLEQTPNLSYSDHAEIIISKIGEGDFVLVAESYSGVIAYEIYQKKCINIQHIVFVASFLDKPSFLSNFARFIPITAIKNKLIPKSLIGRFLFGSDNTQILLELFYSALNHVDNSVLYARINQISNLTKPNKHINIPCTYIKAKNDNLISNSAVNAFTRICENIEIIEVSGNPFSITNKSQRMFENNCKYLLLRN